MELLLAESSDERAATHPTAERSWRAPTTSLQIGQFSRDRSGMFAENGIGGRQMSRMKLVRSN
jgi:hypothetical protein